ncbi:TPA: hypothetical protein ACXPYB_002590 [Klebsiella pneumoniae]|uniref:hypothetical protein n=1 Tax=Klebsiella pneumoniae TaxID=573 RepID=UPI00191925EA|nr:hypothetical protein [Klebsiella pneumoniae]ELA1818784.1 hypothetical protein [Klebsiella pneumoniae]MDP0838020.1 hypothetical protein [Klebsiella pneumoniae]MDP0866184.1 hypothetical protein [Klebsiella pneumoniae]HBT9375101.1 hypothetical protein [Klebsiella pneumoniae]HBY4539023.1 hypothetical protein [Klebsiella pneumoniae]
MNDIFKSEINKGNIFSFLFLKEKEDEHVYKKFFMFCKNENIKITELIHNKKPLTPDDKYIILHAICNLLNFEKTTLDYFYYILTTAEVDLNNYLTFNTFSIFVKNNFKADSFEHSVSDIIKNKKELINLIPLMSGELLNISKVKYFDGIKILIKNSDEYLTKATIQSIKKINSSTQEIGQIVLPFLITNITDGLSNEIKKDCFECMIYLSQYSIQICDALLNLLKNDTHEFISGDFLLFIMGGYHESTPDTIKIKLKDVLFSKEKLNFSSTLDFSLVNILTKYNYNDAEDIFLWIIKTADKELISNLQSTFYHIATNRTLYSKLLLKLFNASDIKFNNVATKICLEIKNKNLELDINNTNDQVDYLSILKRINHLLFSYPDKVITLTMHIFNNNPSNDNFSIFREVIVRNYPSEVRKLIEDYESTTENPFINECKYAISETDQNWQGIEYINELRCSNDEIRAFQSIQYENMKEIHDEAEKKSFFSSLFGSNKIIILYGNGSVIKNNTKDANEERQEIKLSTHKFSHEIPSGLIHDPLGLEMQLSRLKKEGLEK